MLNIHAFRKERFSSHTVGVLSFLSHQIGAAGSYVIRAHTGDRTVRELELTCLDDEASTQVDVDLAQRTWARSAEKSNLRIRAHGRVLLYCSTGTAEYRVAIALRQDNGDEKIVFDSEKLGRTDQVIINPIVPGDYSVTIGSTQKAGKITVTKSRGAGSPVFELEPQRALIEERGMTPPAVELVPGQPLVFESAKPLRFDITRSKP